MTYIDNIGIVASQSNDLIHVASVTLVVCSQYNGLTGVVSITVYNRAYYPPSSKV